MPCLCSIGSAGPGCACRRALDDTDIDAIFVTEVDRCVQDQGKLMVDWWDIAEFGHLGKCKMYKKAHVVLNGNLVDGTQRF